MQAGRTENIGWSVHFDAQYDNVSMLYHTEEDKDRLCGSRCCQKKDVIFTHTDEKVAEKVLRGLQRLHQKYKSSPEVENRRAEVSALREIQQQKSRQFVQDNLDNVKDNMLEYLI